MDLTALEIELTRMAIWYAVISALGFIITMYVLYLVIRAAIRDGIKDSGLVGPWFHSRGRTPTLETDTMPPDMTAER